MGVDWDHHRSISPFPPSQHLPEFRQLGFHVVALGAEACNFLKHSLKQCLSRSRWNSSLLKLKHFLTLAPDLNVHAFDSALMKSRSGIVP